MGRRDIDAYHAVYAGNTNTGKKQVYDLKRRPEVRARILELQTEATQATHLTIAEKRRYLANLVRTGVEDSAARWMAKLKAIEFDTKLSGELRDVDEGRAVEPGSLEEALAQLMQGSPDKEA